MDLCVFGLLVEQIKNVQDVFLNQVVVSVLNMSRKML